MKVLVVDDDVELVGLLKFALVGAGYDVVTAFDGEQALQMQRLEKPDLVILDVNLPYRSGFEVLDLVRMHSGVPVMMLTVRASEEDEVRGLQLGADDYLRKPFSPRTLLARVRSLLRRGLEPGDAMPRSAGLLELVPERSEARIGEGEPFRISALELRLLRALMAPPARPVDADRLIGVVWSDREAGDREALKQLVHRLRRKLVAAGGSAAWLAYLPNVGYVLEVPGRADPAP